MDLYQPFCFVEPRNYSMLSVAFVASSFKVIKEYKFVWPTHFVLLLFVLWIRCLKTQKLPRTTFIPDKIRNATRRINQPSGRSQVMGQFRFYRCKGMSGSAALHIVCNQASKMCTRKLDKNQVGVKL